jgi:hypothetical protein
MAARDVKMERDQRLNSLERKIGLSVKEEVVLEGTNKKKHNKY